MTKTLFGKILLMALVVIISVSLITGFFTNYFMKKFVIENMRQGMIRQGERVVQEVYRRLDRAERTKGMMANVSRMGKIGEMRENMIEVQQVLGTRIWLMDTQGRIFMDKNATRQLNDRELQQMLNGKIITKYNWNDESNEPILTVAIPFKEYREELGGVSGLFIVTSMKEIYDVQMQLRRIIFSSAWIGAFIAVVLAFLFSRRLTSPILAMKNMINRMRQGDFSGQLKVRGQDELSELAHHFNSLNSELNETISLLHTEQEQTQQIINSMAEGVISVDNNDEIVIINPTAKRLLKMATEGKVNFEDEKNSSKTIVFSDILQNVPFLSEQIALVRNNKSALMREIEFKGFVLLSIVSPICTESEEILGVVIVVQDVTNRWRLIKLQKELIANVSHEFKTPLTSIKGFVELMLDNKIKDEQATKSSLEIIHNETLRLIKMVEEMLTTARIEARKLRKEKVNLEEIVGKVVDNLELKLNEANVNVKIDLAFEEKIAVDAAQIEQVFYNLIDNAIRFSPSGGTIEIDGRKNEKLIEIQIRDQGPGIPEEEQELIFDRFYKIEKARSSNDSGSGLGLAIVKNIIKAHGGKITVTNHPEVGAVFTITFPLE